jgi:GMP synthase-like glutamine amidotransferase
MTIRTESPINVANLDLYNGEPNLGMHAIERFLLNGKAHYSGRSFRWQVFDVRRLGEVPDLSFEVYISSGGPGSPFDGVGLSWEADYFRWVEAVWQYNERHRSDGTAKHVLFICHSFQLMCRHFGIAEVTERRSPSFGVLPVHPTTAGLHDPLFRGLTDPFYAADFRRWQVVHRHERRLAELGAQILAREKIRPDVALEQAIMGIRISPEMVGVQFHPEAHPPGMLRHFNEPERRASVVAAHGEAKFRLIVERLKDRQYLARTHRNVVPNFLHAAIGEPWTERPGSIGADRFVVPAS